MRVRQPFAVIVGSLMLFGGLALVVLSDRTPWLDARILSWVPPSNEPNRLSDLCNALIVVGMAAGTAFAALVFIWLILLKERRAAAFWFASLAGAIVLDVTLKPVFERTPIADASNGYSFPSGNALGSMALLLATRQLMVQGRARRLFFAIGSVMVAVYGAALVYISWHYPSDVVAGWLLSTAWVLFLSVVIRPRPVFDFGRLRIPWRDRGIVPRVTANRSRAGTD